MTGMRDPFGTGYCIRDERFARGLIGQTSRWAKSAHSLAAKAEPTTRPEMACEAEKLARSSTLAGDERPPVLADNMPSHPEVRSSGSDAPTDPPWRLGDPCEPIRSNDQYTYVVYLWVHHRSVALRLCLLASKHSHSLRMGKSFGMKGSCITRLTTSRISTARLPTPRLRAASWRTPPRSSRRRCCRSSRTARSRSCWCAGRAHPAYQGDSLGRLVPGIDRPTSLSAIKEADDDLAQSLSAPTKGPTRNKRIRG
jgi:hypothetical protein